MDRLKQKGQIGVWTIVILGGLLLLGAVFFMGQPDTNVALNPDQNQDPAVQQLAQVAETPEQFVGQQVTVRGEVDDVVAPNALILDVPGEAIDDQVLVISPNALSQEVIDKENILDDNELTVQGTVNQFVLAEVRDNLDPNLNPDALAVYEGRPFIWAPNL